MLNDLGGSLMVASAYRHCLATETTDITTSEGRRADTVIDEDARLVRQSKYSVIVLRYFAPLYRM